MYTTNTDFINATGGTATTRKGYDARSLENINLKNKRGMVISQVKNHTTFIDPKNADYYKAVTEYADGTAVSQLNTNDYSRVRIRDIN